MCSSFPFFKRITILDRHHHRRYHVGGPAAQMQASQRPLKTYTTRKMRGKRLSQTLVNQASSPAPVGSQDEPDITLSEMSRRMLKRSLQVCGDLSQVKAMNPYQPIPNAPRSFFTLTIPVSPLTSFHLALSSCAPQTAPAFRHPVSLLAATTLQK